MMVLFNQQFDILVKLFRSARFLYNGPRLTDNSRKAISGALCVDLPKKA